MFAFTIPIEARPARPNCRLRLPAFDPVATRDDEIVRLRPDWPALIATTRFARRATWLFGHRVGVLECADRRVRSCAQRSESGDPIGVCLDFTGWSHAVARRRAAAREIEFYAASGAAIATLRLDDIDPIVDELVWLLIDDDVPIANERTAAGMPRPPDASWLRRAIRLVERREDFDRLVDANSLRRRDAFESAGPHVATQIASDGLTRALNAAVDAGVRVRIWLENAGGSVTWTPVVQQLTFEADYAELRSLYGRMHLSRRIGPSWAVHVSGAQCGGPSIEAESVVDGGWVRVEAASESQRDAWRTICRRLAEE